jgi:hypothetical protein
MAMAINIGRPELRRMTFRLEVEDNWPPVSAESLWVETIGEGRFRIDSTPFLARGVAIDDVVEGWSDGAYEEDMLHFSRKLEKGGHSTIQVIVILDEVAPDIKNEVTETGCTIEVGPWPSLLSIDVPEYQPVLQISEGAGLRHKCLT